MNSIRNYYPIQDSDQISDNMCFQDVFEAQVAQAPNSIALIYKDSWITYGDLAQRANQLAWHLMMLGVKPDTRVGVCMGRSLDMVVAILGVIKAGGAYIPLDPSYPKDRVAFILTDARVDVVVAQEEFQDLFPRLGTMFICMDKEVEQIAQQPICNPKTVIQPDNLVYVLYTSGSTGMPKGVMVTHSNLVNFIKNARSALDVSSDDIYLQSASIAYALSVRQLMIPLAVGATIVIASSVEASDPLELFKLVKNKKITLMDVVPSFWRACIRRLSELRPGERRELMDNSLRRVVSIGEALTWDLPQDWKSLFGPKPSLVNIFGQTETTGVVAIYPIPDEIQGLVGIVPIGHSIPCTRLYIVDSDLNLVPDGVVGELCVSSPCVAQGYLDRPDLTTEKFIVNPFDDGFSSRLYRTGDTARFRSDGNIEFLGRADQQVKIRGQRLELGEVEMVLRKHPAIRDCVVTVCNKQHDDKYLAAYVVTVPGQSSSVTEFKEFARSHLPGYMVPSKFVFLDSLPLTPNGKVDRRALADPTGWEEEQTSKGIILPRTDTEKSIGVIWQEIMNLKRIGIYDNFFDIGGHSLIAVRILTRIERDLGVRLPLTSFFHSATIAQLAELVCRGVNEARDWSPLVPIQTAGVKPPFFGIHAHEGGVLFWRRIVNYMPNDQPFYALQAQGVDGIRPALDRIEDMASLYVDAVRRVQPHGPYHLGGFSMGGEIAFEMAQQLVAQGETINLLVMLDTRNPKWLTPPVFREKNGQFMSDPKAHFQVGYFDFFSKRIQAHCIKMARLSWTGKPAYIIKTVLSKIRESVIYFLTDIYRFIGKRLPDMLLLAYLRHKHSEALRNYVPSKYPGKITLFRASETSKSDPADSPMGWGPLADGGMDVFLFEADHNIVNLKHSKKIACKLNECLENVRKHL